jgi:hypothetical protein
MTRWTKTLFFVKSFFSPTNIVGDLRSSFVGAVVASLLISLVSVFQNRKEIVHVNQNGIASPEDIFDAVEDSGQPLKFVPDDLRRVYVCESTVVEGKSAYDLLIAYLLHYPECFYLIEAERGGRVVIGANERSGSLKKTRGGDWACKCFRGGAS